MIFEKVKAVLVEELTLGEDEITMESNFEELGIDSLDLVELVMKLEEEFDITIEESEELKTIKDVVEYITSAKEA
ncbi:MAG: acyl carrier protein [Clostridia bacterium]|jgi:acyl carrier protein|uniref:Acyl carrier protein n=1 Tax=Proteiniclasticum aestuarii TaxID=2817862 RepID=A0A939KK34_9CLOT|nr:acyl carrier protein [Proteiniclasticum aestuarii]MBO1265681.1 acyl carrier protein [Proteiniclasticum aestuarii]NCC79278.1 acyl carrier protein [Clostridia bacterium]